MVEYVVSYRDDEFKKHLCFTSNQQDVSYLKHRFDDVQVTVDSAHWEKESELEFFEKK